MSKQMLSEEVLSILRKADRASLFEEKVTHVNQRNVFGDTPLHLACRWGDAIAVRVLIEAGAEVDAVGERGRTPIFETSNLSIAEVLINSGADLRLRDVDGYKVEDVARLLNRKGLAQFLRAKSREIYWL